MGIIPIREVGIYRKIDCPDVKNSIELFYDCLHCKY